MRVQKITNSNLKNVGEIGTRMGLASLLCLLCFGCYFDVIIPEQINETEVISFANDIQPLFNANCVSCHNGNIARPDLSSDNAFDELTAGGYLSISDPEQSILIQQLNSEHPYAGVLTAVELQKLMTWMSQGALNN